MSKIRASTGMGRLVNVCITNGLSTKQVLAILKQVYPHRHTNRHNVDWYYTMECRERCRV